MSKDSNEWIEECMPNFNDLDLTKWRDLDINTDSLWLIAERAKTGKHKNIYHGNFIPQIFESADPMSLRYLSEGGP
jgi:hypothetical protein